MEDSQQKPPAFDRADRQRSLAALALVQLGIVGTMKAIEGTPAESTHPQFGELVYTPKQQLEAILNQLFVVAEYSKDVTEQIYELERVTGVKASSLSLGRYAGVAVPREAQALSIEDGKMMMTYKAPSSLMPDQLVETTKAIVTAGELTTTGELFTLEELRNAKEAFDAEHKRPN